MQAPMTIKQYVSQMCKIPGGRFTMGRTYKTSLSESKESAEWHSFEVPSHPVEVSSFKFGATLVTVGMWREYVRANKETSMPSPPSYDWIDDFPMTVSWNDIMGVDGKGGYCSWASQVIGLKLTLPTEAQWEYAAKGGKDLVYPWGANFDRTKLWCSKPMTVKNGSIVDDMLDRPAPVVRNKYFFQNRFGLIDMSGNHWQWCTDRYGSYEQPSRDRLGYLIPSRDPKGPESGDKRCGRGGSYLQAYPIQFRCTTRLSFSPDSLLGFRLAI